MFSNESLLFDVNMIGYDYQLNKECSNCVHVEEANVVSGPGTYKNTSILRGKV